jgi:guanyl-specific ribonuclease Sa
MPIRDRIIWGRGNPFSDPRLSGLEKYVQSIRRGRLPANVTGGRVFMNALSDLPTKPVGYYREYDVEATVKGKDRGKLRLVLGNGGEVYVTGNHYRDFRQIIDMPT